MKYLRILAIALMASPMTVHADALFGNGLAGDRNLPRTFGIGIDYFRMDQPYRIDSLTFVVPQPSPLPPAIDPSIVLVDNELRNVDIKFDVWLLPFLNVFALYGDIEGETDVDLSGLGLSLPPIAINYDGDVYGGGLVLAGGGERWFASLTATLTDSSLSGEFNSSVDATTLQPRIGARISERAEFWIGGYYIDAEESHSGTTSINLGPLVGGEIPVDFAVDLSQKSDFNLSFGGHFMLSDSWEATIEVGGGDRRTMLANFTYRID
jgi:hypothetical protein